MKILSVYETDKDILEAVDTIFLNNEGFDLDPTYSKGNFYRKQGFKEPKLKSDIRPLYEDVLKMDCRDYIKEKKGWYSSIVFDPPFLFRQRKSINNDKISSRFSFFLSFDELKEMYEGSLRAFNWVLKEKGILAFKCQDMTDGKFYCTHNWIINYAKTINFELVDIFILVKKNKITPDAKKQNCARKVHSYYLIFKKRG